jgi:hypothetical protein
LPYLSEAQRKWAHTESGKKALGGESAVEEWDKATKRKKLPERVNTELAAVHQPERNDNVPSELSLKEESKPEVVPHDEHNSECPGPSNCNCSETMSIKNASQFAKRYYGLHFAPGVAQYQEGDSNPYNIFLNQDTINKMDQSFSGKPVFVNHRNEVSPKDLDQADGYVVKSFYNQIDGKQWCEFLVVSDRGHEAISRGYQLSNAYLVKNSVSGGEWHAVPYLKEVTDAEYEHLALVPNPRYKESVVLTPSEFQRYNDEKSLELKRLTNSKGTLSTMFNFFKRSKVENADLDTMSVVLPRSNAEIALSKLINDADAEAMKDKKMASMDHIVKMNDGKEMSVKELLDAHEATVAKLAAAEQEAADDLKKAEKQPVGEDKERHDKADGGKSEDAKDHDKVMSADDAEGVKADPDMGKKQPDDSVKRDPKVEAVESEDKKMNSSHFNKMKTAERSAVSGQKEVRVNGLELGKQLFGSK